MNELKKKLTEALTDELNQKKALILGKAGDDAEVREALEDIISLKGQLSVIPTEIDIPCEDVIKRYNVTDAIEVVRCRTAILFHSTCFWVVSRPSMANNMQGTALYQMLKWYCDYRDSRDKYEDKDREMYDTLCLMMENILALPMDVFSDNQLMIDIATYIINRRAEYYQALAKEAETLKPETEEDLRKNAEFAEEVRLDEELKKEVGKNGRLKN